MTNFNTKDPYLLLSLLNTKLRDESEDLEDLCITYDLNQEEIQECMLKIGYTYDREIKQFISK